MSPEQARGQAGRQAHRHLGVRLRAVRNADRARCAFAGETVSDTIATILEREPDWSVPAARRHPTADATAAAALPREGSASSACSDIGDVRIEIDAIDEVLPGVAVKTRQARAPWIVAGALALGLAGMAAWNFRPPAPLAVTRFLLTLPSGQRLDGSGAAHMVALSPDGAQSGVRGDAAPALSALDGEADVKPVPETEAYVGVREPVFSPDGGSIAFYAIADQTLKKMAVTGGAAVTLCAADSPTGISWGADGIVFVEAQLHAPSGAERGDAGVLAQRHARHRVARPGETVPTSVAEEAWRPQHEGGGVEVMIGPAEHDIVEIDAGLEIQADPGRTYCPSATSSSGQAPA